MIIKSFRIIFGLALCCACLGLTFTNAYAVECPPGTMRNPGDEAQDFPDIKSVVQCSLPEPEKNADGSERTIMSVVKDVINTILTCVGVISVIVIIIAGISFITSQGDTTKVIKAKNAILYSVIGLIISLLAFAIVNFVLSGIFGSPKASDSSSETATP